jgi:hypothetical protein
MPAGRPASVTGARDPSTGGDAPNPDVGAADGGDVPNPGFGVAGGDAGGRGVAGIGVEAVGGVSTGGRVPPSGA